MDAPGDERRALILYASETGNAHDIAKELDRLCERLRFNTTLCDFNSVKISQLLRYSLVVISISTTGQGDLPANCQLFWRALRSIRLAPDCLSGVRFVSFGLGDSSYPKFNWAHRKLYNRLLQLGARSVYDRGEADEQFSEGIDGTFVPWLLNLKTRLLKEYPLPEGIQPVPDDVNIEPKWVLELADLNGDYAGLDLPRPQPSQDEPPPDFIPILGGITATVHSNNRLTPQSHFQDTRHLILTLSGNHQYEPGATVTIYPKNFPSDVNDFIKWMEWDSIADKPLKFVSTRASLSSALPIPNLDLNNTTPLTLRTLLTNHLDIMSIPRRSFFTHLLQHTSNPMHQERLLEFLAPEYIDELYDYTTRPRRSILEVLSDISSVRLPWQTVCDVIPALRGRQFSIASGGVLKSPTTTTTTTTDDGEREGTGQTEAVAATAAAGHEQATSTRVDLLVAIVRYRTIIRRVRHGVATRYIATLRPGQALRVTLQPSALGFVPTAAAAADLLRRPVVMIAPGTGVAPMRSLAWERKMLRERHRSRDADAVAIPDAERWGCKDVLFFGCRKKGVDEYFRDEWDEKELGVDVFTAWSQEQRQKVYVQDLVREHAKVVFEVLAEHRGLVFVCGSSGRMPQAVRQALTWVFETQGDMTITDAELYLSKMEKEGRYKQETW